MFARLPKKPRMRGVQKDSWPRSGSNDRSGLTAVLSIRKAKSGANARNLIERSARTPIAVRLSLDQAVRALNKATTGIASQPEAASRLDPDDPNDLPDLPRLREKQKDGIMMIGYRHVLLHSSAAIPGTGDLTFFELKPGSWADDVGGSRSLA